jgi:hypothetical protein
MSNIEGLYSIYFYKKVERSGFHTSKFDIRYSIFCGSLFSPTAGCQIGQCNHQETVPFWCNLI